MSNSSPADLAVTFRSIPRRLREAYGDDTPRPGSDLATQLAAAARLLGTTADPAAIAGAIDAVKADQWDQGTLDGLRQVGLDVGAELRRIAAEHDAKDSD
jgi:hypothetical protein